MMIRSRSVIQRRIRAAYVSKIVSRREEIFANHVGHDKSGFGFQMYIPGTHSIMHSVQL
jgi:hypothetical protein